MTQPDANLRKQLNDMIRGYWTTQALFVAAELDLAGRLGAGARTPSELAAEAGAVTGNVYRILRALASVGVFEEDADGRFALTPLGQTLASPGGQAYARLHGLELYRAWGHMLETVRTGQPAFVQEYGVRLFEYMSRNPERGQVFDRAMSGHHGDETDPMLDSYDFSQFGTLVDVGGGNGSLLIGALGRFPDMRGVLFDLPAVAERARAAISDAGLGGRIEVAGGDAFDPGAVPSGGDAYILRHVVHDFADEDARVILSNVRRAAGPGGRLLVVEMVIPPGNDPFFGKWLDLMMMAYGGRERTEKEYRTLFLEAGFELTRVVDTGVGVALVEGVSRG